MERVMRFLLVVVAMMLGTWYVGWWTVPVVAAVWAGVEEGDRALPLKAALAGCAAWGILLAAQMPGGGTKTVADTVGTLLGLGGAALVLLTMLYPALLAGSAAGVVRAVRSR